jgi:predicted acyl esterase
MRASWALPLLAIPLLAGCLAHHETPRAEVPAAVGYDPTTVHVDGVRVANLTLISWDGSTRLATSVYAPSTNDTLPGGAAVQWPIVVFLHGWGETRHSFDGTGKGAASSPIAPPDAINRLQEFAESGLIAVGYDARGFGDSTGEATVAGPAELADLHSVIQQIQSLYHTQARVGIVGGSYGGGQALEAWAKDPLVTTAVSAFGWTDLYDGLIPGNVPKLEWAQFLYAYGLAGAHGRYDPMIHDWYRQLYTRNDLPTVHAQMDQRSARAFMAGVQKPLFLCQGLEETLFPQIDDAWSRAPGFVRAYVFTGGHGDFEEGCWSRARDWFAFFLSGFDTHVDTWPALETTDTGGAGSQPFAQFPNVAGTAFRLRDGDLSTGVGSNATFTIQQTGISNPGSAPAGVSDLLGEPAPFYPDALKQDPTALTFTTAALPGSQSLLGTPSLALHVASGDVPFQVAATLSMLKADGSSQAIGHAAFAALARSDLAADGTAPLRFQWTNAELSAGDKVVLRLASNDSSWWVPLGANYSVTFDGQSTLVLPIG